MLLSTFQRFVLTSHIFYVTESSCPTYGHVCKNSRCIDDDVACNGYNSCGDDSGCDLGTAAIVGIVIGGIIGLGMIISLVVCCFCCQKRSGHRPGTVQVCLVYEQVIININT